jgi:hypothetical protein
MVDPHFAINPLDPKSKEGNIIAKGDISSNMTKLGTHIKISGSGNAFNKKEIWGNNIERRSQKAGKKEEFKDPTVYFTLIVSCNVKPQEIIDQIAHEWNKSGGTKLQIKELQDMDSKMVVSFFRVSTATRKEVILVELSKILKAALSKVQAELSPIEFFKHDFSTEPDVSKDLPDMTLQLQHAKLQGIDTSAFNKLKFHAQMASRSWHLEVASRYVPK